MSTEQLVGLFVERATSVSHVGEIELFGFEVCASRCYRASVIKRLVADGWLERTSRGTYRVVRA